MNPISLRIIDATPSAIRRPVELVVRTIDDSIEDRVPGLAAEIAFYVMLSIPPLLLAVLGTVGYVGERLGPGFQADAVASLLDLAAAVLTRETIVGLELNQLFSELVSNGRGDVASLGFILTIYAASRAVRVVIIAVTIAYDLEDQRPGWQQRLWGVAITLVGVLVGLVVIPLLVVGPGFGEQIDGLLGLENVVTPLWSTFYWPGAVLVAMALTATLYHVGAPWWTKWRRDLPGAALAVGLWIVGSFGLRLYTEYTLQADSIYAPFAGPLVLLLWLYLSGLAVLLGAELNAELEKMSTPEIVPGLEKEQAMGQATEPAGDVDQPA